MIGQIDFRDQFPWAQGLEREDCSQILVQFQNEAFYLAERAFFRKAKRRSRVMTWLEHTAIPFVKDNF